MKKFFLGAIIVIFLAGWATHYVRNGVERFIPLIAGQFEREIGKKVEYGPTKILLGWPLGFQISDLRILEERASGSLLLKSDEVSLYLDLFSWISKKQLLIKSAELNRIHLNLIKNKFGTWNWDLNSRYRVPKNDENVLSRNLESPQPLKIQKIKIRGAMLLYKNEMLEPVEFHAVMLSEVMLNLDQDFLTYEAQGIAEIQWNQIKAQFRLVYDAEQDTLNFHLKSLQEDWDFLGDILGVASEQSFRFNANVRGVNLRTILGPKDLGAESLSGRLTLSIEGAGQGLSLAELRKTLTFDGAMDVREGSIDGVNFFRDVLLGIDGVKLPDQFKDGLFANEANALLKADQTPFDIFQAEIGFAEGRLFSEKVVIQHPFYILQGIGSCHPFEKDVNFQAKLATLKPMSDLLTAQVKELNILENKEGRVVVPFWYRGLLPNAAVVADAQILAKSKISAMNDQKDDNATGAGAAMLANLPSVGEVKL